MSETMTVRPVEGRRVRDPVSKMVLEGPLRVPLHDPHWHELVRWGDVEIVPEGEAIAEVGPASVPEAAADPAPAAVEPPPEPRDPA